MVSSVILYLFAYLCGCQWIALCVLRFDRVVNLDLFMNITKLYFLLSSWQLREPSLLFQTHYIKYLMRSFPLRLYFLWFLRDLFCYSENTHHLFILISYWSSRFQYKHFTLLSYPLLCAEVSVFVISNTCIWIISFPSWFLLRFCYSWVGIMGMEIIYRYDSIQRRCCC